MARRNSRLPNNLRVRQLKYHIIEEGWQVDHYVVEASSEKEAINKVSLAPELGLEPEISDFVNTEISAGCNHEDCDFLK